jgi:hypothetical protein
VKRGIALATSLAPMLGLLCMTGGAGAADYFDRGYRELGELWQPGG